MSNTIRQCHFHIDRGDACHGYMFLRPCHPPGKDGCVLKPLSTPIPDLVHTRSNVKERRSNKSTFFPLLSALLRWEEGRARTRVGREGRGGEQEDVVWALKDEKRVRLRGDGGRTPLIYLPSHPPSLPPSRHLNPLTRLSKGPIRTTVLQTGQELAQQEGGKNEHVSKHICMQHRLYNERFSYQFLSLFLSQR